MTATLHDVDLDLVAEGHEEVPCSGAGCRRAAVIWTSWRCGCVKAACLPLWAFICAVEATGSEWECNRHGRVASPGIVRTWPVTR